MFLHLNHFDTISLKKLVSLIFVFTLLDDPIEFQLLNKFLYYTVIRRVSNTVWNEVFFKCIDPAFRDEVMSPNRILSETDSKRDMTNLNFIASEASFFQKEVKPQN